MNKGSEKCSKTRTWKYDINNKKKRDMGKNMRRVSKRKKYVKNVLYCECKLSEKIRNSKYIDERRESK